VRLLQPEIYQPLADSVYGAIAAQLRSVLPGATVEHVGSSAVPGAISKGDVDVYVGVRSDEFLQAIETLRGLGFRDKTDTLRTDQLCPFAGEGFPMDVGIQLIERGSRFEFFRRFRDLLKGNPELLQRYNQLKRDAALLDETAYRALKSSFIETVLSAADSAELP
jgi:GrpB-like predicted nucleotidyltransferase (UPF0157 family)